jgi:hypothetical protein
MLGVDLCLGAVYRSDDRSPNHADTQHNTSQLRYAGAAVQ